MSPPTRPHLLPARPDLPGPVRERLRADADRFARDGLPDSIEDYLCDEYGVAVAGSYAGRPVRCPFGKASGQLSMTAAQVAEAAESGLGFVVLKTVIAQDAAGRRSMEAWALPEARMDVEPIVGRDSGAPGWTVSWKGRGWSRSLEDYLALIRAANQAARPRGVLVVPSVKYHLPGPGQSTWQVGEYEETTRRILAAVEESGAADEIPALEKDFSPTLAGSDRATAGETVLNWLDQIPTLIRQAAAPRPVRVGLKLFNSLLGEEFQLAMLRFVAHSGGSDFLVYANRLFDPERPFQGMRGIAYGGPDLSDRNLRALTAFRSEPAGRDLPELSATGDISSGRIAVEYALRGATSFQVHTLFQLPNDQFALTRGTKLQRALHRLYFDPDEGLVAWLLHATGRVGLGPRLMDLAQLGATADPRALADALR